DERQRGGVAVARAELGDASVAAGAVAKARRDLVEQLSHHRAAADEGERLAARVQGAALAERDHAVRPAPQFLRFRIGRLQVLILEQRSDQVAQQRTPMAGAAVELSAALQMSHRGCSDLFNAKTQRRGDLRLESNRLCVSASLR